MELVSIIIKWGRIDLDGMIILWGKNRKTVKMVMEMNIWRKKWKRKTEELVKCDWVLYENYWCMHEWCGISSQVEVEDQDGWPQIAGKIRWGRKRYTSH